MVSVNDFVFWSVLFNKAFDDAINVRPTILFSQISYFYRVLWSTKNAQGGKKGVGGGTGKKRTKLELERVAQQGGWTEQG